MKRIVLLLLIAALVIAFFAFDLDHWLTFEAIKQSQARFDTLRAEMPWQLAGAFFLIYVAVTALSLPGATVMTLAIGGVFGLAAGTVLVSFASTIGATLAFLVSRYVLRDGVQRRFSDKLKAVNEGIAKDGAFYLFTLRLVPAFPFFLINLVMGLTPLRTATFYWVSQIGMLAGTLVYVNAGTQVGQLDSPAGILSPGLIFSFALLGVFPLITHRALRHFQRLRVYAKWKRPKRYDRNLVVITHGAKGIHGPHA